MHHGEERGGECRQTIIKVSETGTVEHLIYGMEVKRYGGRRMEIHLGRQKNTLSARDTYAKRFCFFL